MALDTEEEQVEKIQKFWEVYKRYIISLIVVLLGIYFAFNFYAKQNIKNLEISSQLYQEILIEKVTSIDTILEKVNLLKNTSSNTPSIMQAPPKRLRGTPLVLSARPLPVAWTPSSTNFKLPVVLSSCLPRAIAPRWSSRPAKIMADSTWAALAVPPLAWPKSASRAWRP